MDNTFVSIEVFEEYKRTCEAKKEVEEAKRANLEAAIDLMKERITDLESEQKQISEIATSVAVMSVSVDNLSKEVRTQNENMTKVIDGFEKRMAKTESAIENIKLSPGDTFNKLKLAAASCVVTGIVGAIVVWVIASI